MQFSMARKFMLRPLCSYNVKHSITRSFMFDAPGTWSEKSKEHRQGTNQHPLDLSPTTPPLRHNFIIDRV
jgi:hypothetical protein